MNNLSALTGWASRTPWRPGAPDWLARPGLPRAAHGRSRCLGIHMCTAHQNRQRPAPRGLGRPQIGHLELEGKTNHGELWDACLSSVAPAVAAQGRAGGAGAQWLFGSRAPRNIGAPETADGSPSPLQTLLRVPSPPLPLLLIGPLPAAPCRPACTHVCPAARAEPDGVRRAPLGPTVPLVPGAALSRLAWPFPRPGHSRAGLGPDHIKPVQFTRMAH